MTKVRSGLILMGISILLNIVGRLLMPGVRDSHNIVLAGLLALVEFVSAVMFLFGLFRLIVGLVSKK